MDCVGSLFVQKNNERQFEEFRCLKLHFIIVVIVIEIQYDGQEFANECVPLLPGTDDEDDRTTISSRSSVSTSTSGPSSSKAD